MHLAAVAQNGERKRRAHAWVVSGIYQYHYLNNITEVTLILQHEVSPPSHNIASASGVRWFRYLSAAPRVTSVARHRKRQWRAQPRVIVKSQQQRPARQRNHVHLQMALQPRFIIGDESSKVRKGVTRAPPCVAYHASSSAPLGSAITCTCAHDSGFKHDLDGWKIATSHVHVWKVEARR